MINPAFERHDAIQINHDRSLWNVEEQNGQQPKKEMCLSKLGGGADPARADDKEDLRENQIAQTERLFESSAVSFDLAFRAVEFGGHGLVKALER